MNNDFMNTAFINAKIAFDNDEVPIGAVIVKDGKIVSCGYNSKEKDKKCTSHAELIAIEKASEILDNWRLDGCDIYVTLDPCPMCASAIKQSRISNVYSALNNLDSNNLKILSEIFKADSVNPEVNFISNLDSNKSKILLSKFFSSHRKKNND